MPWYAFFTRTKILPSFSKGVVKQARIIAEIHNTYTALTVLRFRDKTGRLPENLSDLVPDYVQTNFGRYSHKKTIQL